MSVQMLVLEEEPQPDQPDIEVRIRIDNRIVTHQGRVLCAELRSGATEQRRVIRRVVAHVCSELGIQCSEPAAVVVQVAV